MLEIYTYAAYVPRTAIANTACAVAVLIRANNPKSQFSANIGLPMSKEHKIAAQTA